MYPSCNYCIIGCLYHPPLIIDLFLTIPGICLAFVYSRTCKHRFIIERNEFQYDLAMRKLKNERLIALAFQVRKSYLKYMEQIGPECKQLVNLTARYSMITVLVT